MFFFNSNAFFCLCNPLWSLFKNRPIAFIAHDNAKKNLNKIIYVKHNTTLEIWNVILNNWVAKNQTNNKCELQKVDGQQGSLGHSKHVVLANPAIVGDDEAQPHDQNICKVKVKLFPFFLSNSSSLNHW